MKSSTPDKLNELRADLKSVMVDRFSRYDSVDKLLDEMMPIITTAYAEAIRGAVPEKRNGLDGISPEQVRVMSPDQKQCVQYESIGFNWAIDTFTTNLKNQGLLPNGKDE